MHLMYLQVGHKDTLIKRCACLEASRLKQLKQRLRTDKECSSLLIICTYLGCIILVACILLYVFQSGPPRYSTVIPLVVTLMTSINLINSGLDFDVISPGSPVIQLIRMRKSSFLTICQISYMWHSFTTSVVILKKQFEPTYMFPHLPGEGL